MSQMAQKLLHLWRHSQKNATPHTKNFFECRQEDCRSVWALEQLSSAIGGGARALLRQPEMIIIRCQAKFLTSHHIRMHRVIFYIPNTLIKLIV